MVCEDFGLIGINYDSIQEIKFNYAKLGRHVGKKKFKDHAVKKNKLKKNSSQKNPKSRIGAKKTKKVELKTVNKTSNGIGRFISFFKFHFFF